MQVESLFQAMQKSVAKNGGARQKLAVLDLKRATAVGIRMSRLRYHCEQLGGLLSPVDMIVGNCV